MRDSGIHIIRPNKHFGCSTTTTLLTMISQCCRKEKSLLRPGVRGGIASSFFDEVLLRHILGLIKAYDVLLARLL